jgi:mannose-1-phosphate guanylyltransferase
MRNRYVVIMAGGRGERFWPCSRLSRPKHLLPIVGATPILAQTIDRLGADMPRDHVLIITNGDQLDAVRAACPDIPAANVIAEPVGRDTAAAVGLAAILVAQRDPQAAFAVLPADHVIHDRAAYSRTLEAAFSAAEAEDVLVTLGITPTHPATGYGYIQRGEQVGSAAELAVHAVAAFREKPDADTARGYLEAGDYLWNAGMFFWRVPVITDALARLAPGIWRGLQPIAEGLRTGGDRDALLARHYPDIPKISIDYAVMEKAAAVRVIEAPFDWDDVGEWPALARHHPADAAGNVCVGQARIMDGRGNIILSDPDHLVALIGVDDLVVVHTADATLVCPRDRAQDIKALVTAIAADPQTRHLI